MNITNEGHVEKLEYGWWEAKRGHVLLPATLKDPRNYVLTHEELCHYNMVLIELMNDVAKEHARVENTIKVLRKGRTGFLHEDPVCYTLCHVMEFMIATAKSKLNTLNLLNYLAKKRVDEKRRTSEADQSPSSPDP